MDRVNRRVDPHDAGATLAGGVAAPMTLPAETVPKFLTALPDLDTGAEPITLASANLDVEGMIAEVDEKGLQEFLSEMPDLQTIQKN